MNKKEEETNANAEAKENTKEFDIQEEVKGLFGDEAFQKEFFGEMFAKWTEANERRQKNAKYDDTEEVQEQAKKTEERGGTIKLLKAMSDGDMMEVKRIHKLHATKYLDEGTDTEGGYLVDPEFSSEVFRIMQDYSVFRRNATVIPLKSDRFNLKTIATDPSTFWTDEAAAISGTTMEFGNPYLVPKKLASILPWTEELEEDQYVGLLSIVQERFAESIAQKEEVAFTTGSSPFTGILNASGTTNVTMASGETSFANIHWDDLIDMARALEEVSVTEAANGKYYLSPYVWSLLTKLKTSGDGNYFLYSLTAAKDRTAPNGQMVEVVQSYPGLSADAVSTKFATFCDLKKHAFIGDRGGLRVKMFDAGVVKDSSGTDVNLITQDSKALRVRKRTAYTTILTAAVIHLLTAAS